MLNVFSFLNCIAKQKYTFLSFQVCLHAVTVCSLAYEFICLWSAAGGKRLSIVNVENVGVCMSASLCHPVSKITIDFFFVSDQLGLSGPLVRSIISAHHHADTVAYQWGMILSAISMCVWLHACVLQEAHLQNCLILLQLGDFFFSHWSISTINQNYWDCNC